MKAFLIARVSTDDQTDALPGQVYRLKDYAQKMRYDYELFEIKESAYKGDRVQFNEVLSRVFTVDEAVALVFDKVDRYSRDVSSGEVRTLNSLAESGKIELHFVSDHFIINKESSAGQRLMLTMNTAFSQYYSNAISDNVKRRNEQMRRDGLWTGKAPFGYVNTVRDSKKWIDVDPIKSLAVKDAFSLYASGISTLIEIRKHWLVKYGIRSHTSMVDKVLKNPFYYGTMRVQDRFYEHRYETLVSKELFDQADAVRKGYKFKPHRWGGLPFAYRGLISCADCGCRVTFEIKKKKYIYGHCTQFKGKHGARYVSQVAIDRQIASVIKQITIPDDICKQVLVEINKGAEAKDKNANDQKAAIELQLAKAEARLDRLYEDYIDGNIESNFYERKSSEYKELIKMHQTQLGTFELSANTHLETISHLLELSKNAYNLFEAGDYEEKRKLVKILLSNLELKDDQLGWKLKKPFNLMAFCNNNSSWQGHEESNLNLRFWRPLY